MKPSSICRYEKSTLSTDPDGRPRRIWVKEFLRREVHRRSPRRQPHGPGVSLSALAALATVFPAAVTHWRGVSMLLARFFEALVHFEEAPNKPHILDNAVIYMHEFGSPVIRSLVAQSSKLLE